MGKISRSHFLFFVSAGRQYKRGGSEGSVTGFYAEAVSTGNVRDPVADPDLNAAMRTFGQQHGDDGARRAIAK